MISGLLITTILVTAIGVSVTHTVMHRDADRILKNATQREGAYINDTLGDIAKSAAIMEHYAISMMEKPEQLRDEEFRESYLRKSEQMFIEIATHTKSVDGFYLRMDPEWTDGTSGFYKRANKVGDLIDMPLTDLDRSSIEEHAKAYWYYEAVAAGDGVWTDPYYSVGDPNQKISYLRPVYVNGKLIGVLGFDVNFTRLVQRVGEIALYEEGYAVLVDKDGVTQYNEIPESHNDVTFCTIDEATTASVKLENGMFLQIHADYSDIQREIRPMLLDIVLAFATVLAVAIVFTVLVTNRMVAPLKGLTNAALDLMEHGRESDLSLLEVDSKDEIGTLSKVLKTCVIKIGEYTDYVNALAYRDVMTGIPNNTAFSEASEKMNKVIDTEKSRFAVLVADINNLKRVNDNYGHMVGNEVIISAAGILTSTFRTSQVFRVAGDEFIVILKGSDYENYPALLIQLDKACAAAVINANGQPVALSIARGVSEYEPENDGEFGDILSRADRAMFLHKKESKLARTC